MYEPTGENHAIGVSSATWVPAGNYSGMSDQNLQFVAVQPNVLHRCTSTPFLGTQYSFHNSPPEHIQGSMHHHKQMFFYPGTSVNDAAMHAHHYPGPSHHYKVGDGVYSTTSVSRQIQEMRVADYQQGNVRSESKKCCDLEYLEENKQVSTWKQIYEEKVNELNLLKKQYTTFTKYAESLETREESMQKSRELEKMKDMNHKLEIKVNEKVAENRKLQKKLIEKDALVENLQQKTATLKQHLDAYNRKRLQDGRKQYDTEEDFLNLMAEREELISQFRGKKDELDREVVSRKKSDQKYKTEIIQLSEKLERENSSFIALSEDNKIKEGKIDTLKRQLRERSTQKQSLLEDLQDLREQVKFYTQNSTATEERKILEKQLIKEIVSVVGQIQNLAEFCSKDNSGEDMNVSLILGTHEQTLPHSSMERFDSFEELLSHQIQVVRKIRDEIRSLQETLSTNYAVRLGSKLNL